MPAQDDIHAEPGTIFLKIECVSSLLPVPQSRHAACANGLGDAARDGLRHGIGGSRT